MSTRPTRPSELRHDRSRCQGGGMPSGHIRAHRRLVGTILFAIGCGGDTGSQTNTTAAATPAPQAITRDRAAIAISESEDVQGRIGEWQVADEPLLTIGAELRAPAEYQFETISGAIRLPTGGILVADRAALREYDEGGSYVQSWGRMGDGPGEFQFIGGLRKMGSDSVVVWDRWPRRLTVFDINGNLGRTFTIPEAPQLFLLGVTGNRIFVFERIVTLHFDLNTGWTIGIRARSTNGCPAFVEVRSATGGYDHRSISARRTLYPSQSQSGAAGYLLLPQDDRGHLGIADHCGSQ